MPRRTYMLPGEVSEADDGPRTRDLELGKLALYQLSYVRAAAIVPLRGGGHGRPRASLYPCLKPMKRVLSPLPLAVCVGVLALLALLAYGLAAAQPDRALDVKLAGGERVAAPSIALPRLDGRGQTSLAELKGQVVVLNYWASWCEPCRQESPLLERWHRRIGPRGGTVLGVDVLDVSDDAREFVKELGLSYPIVRDTDAKTQGEFGVAAYPETILIDRAGRVVALVRGPVDDDFFRRQVMPLLEERV